MLNLRGGPVERAARLLGIPPGTGELVTDETRRKLLLSGGGSIVLSLLDTLGVVAMLPMMQYITDQDRDSGALGVVNRLLGEPGDRVLVGVLALIIVGAFVVKDLFALVFRWWQLGFMAHNQVAIQARLLEGYLTGPYAWHLTKNTSDKLWTVSGAVGLGYTSGLTATLGFFTEVLTIGFIFVSLLFVSPVATLAALVYFGLAGLVVQRVIRPRILQASQRNLEASQAVSKSSLQALTAVKEIKLRQAHGPFVATFTEASDMGARAGATASWLSEVPKYFLEMVFIVGVGLLAIGASSTSSSGESLTLIGIFTAAGTRILPSAVRLINALAGIRFARAPLAHVVQENRALQDERNAEAAARVTDVVPTGDVEVRGLTFAYADQPEDHVLRGVDLDVPQGRTIAIVGSSGAGKSTFVDILLGLHRPAAGSITAGGTSIFDNLPDWQRQLAVVPQDVTLLDETLRANIAFDEEVDEARLDEALERAQLSDLVRSLPLGLDTEVGERGVRLSGGQRQRIGIARALYRRPRLLVLDEATSALDNETERRLTETIEGLKGTMTIVIVAHRLSTVRHSDRLVFMSQGRVATVGTFDEVAADNAEFARLVELGQLTPTTAGAQADA
ncbi:ABC transporter ATP-binding protein [Nocardioides okcheonensis]|uniref:ABC transporter ATP-binding protein n=1 Tax=Nocardioides okcheonensis TaxID=2894081 RepID=UPI001E3C0017|nr:ABC transporter ATP-binding protein [Nocardioides okcheonensis]UFN46565.1 ABC transporter ATP-binding protein/permease [Nocardioides okcheonensis]